VTRAFATGALALKLVKTSYRRLPHCPLPQRLAAFHRPPGRPPLAPPRFLRLAPEGAPAGRRGTGRLPQTAPAGLGGTRRAAARALPTPRHARGARHLVPRARALQRVVGTAAPVAPGPGLGDQGAALGPARTPPRALPGGPLQGEGLDRALRGERGPERFEALMRRVGGGGGPGLHPPWRAAQREHGAWGAGTAQRWALAARAPRTSAPGRQTLRPGATSEPSPAPHRGGLQVLRHAPGHVGPRVAPGRLLSGGPAVVVPPPHPRCCLLHPPWSSLLPRLGSSPGAREGGWYACGPHPPHGRRVADDVWREARHGARHHHALGPGAPQAMPWLFPTACPSQRRSVPRGVQRLPPPTSRAPWPGPPSATRACDRVPRGAAARAMRPGPLAHTVPGLHRVSRRPLASAWPGWRAPRPRPPRRDRRRGTRGPWPTGRGEAGPCPGASWPPSPRPLPRSPRSGRAASRDARRQTSPSGGTEGPLGVRARCMREGQPNASGSPVSRVDAVPPRRAPGPWAVQSLEPRTVT